MKPFFPAQRHRTRPLLAEREGDSERNTRKRNEDVKETNAVVFTDIHCSYIHTKQVHVDEINPALWRHLEQTRLHKEHIHGLSTA